MMKLSYFVRSRSAVSEKVAGKVSNTSNALWTHCFTTQAGTRSNQIFADYTVFKGKAALSVYPLLPKFNESETSSKYDKKGCILLKFWPAIGERKYDWQKRQMIALSPTEVGSLISLEPGKSCEFFHDPSMKSSNAGQVRKSLSVTPLGEDGYMFNLSKPPT
ncbi:hypothetical protein AQUCO_01400047v1 [Aquilegia coerulea]|uniref:Uncharacterized protein n=1 Tax=Aquilegia coerulea TaxID=218851 RepID=A0A2G5DUB0_AQUCA|nr:hypothetical protein AQUCO_01400047v1 [Aquilegia coerulea]